MKIQTLILILLSLPVLRVSGQDVQFKAKAPEVVEVNEHFKLTYTVNSDDAENIQVPKFSDFDYSGPSRSTQTSVKIVNGKMSRKVNTSYAYFMKPKQTGTFKIGPASIEVDGKTYKSNGVTIKVIKAKQGQAQGGSGQKEQSTGRGVSKDKVFVRLHLNKGSVYRNEHIVATIKIYTKLDIAALQEFEAPPFNGFWSNEIETPGNITFERENVNGTIYHSGVFAKYLIFPRQSGSITIDPAKLKLAVRKQVAKPSFFDSGYRNIEVNLSSRPRTVNVKSLPGGAPLSFNGAVGNFDIEANVSKKTVEANNAINYKIKLSGNGNIKLVEPFSISFPSDFDQFDPEISQNVRNSTSGASGSKKYDYLLIPRYAGDFTIPSVEFTYFNPETGRYHTKTTEAFDIHVEKGDQQGGGRVVTNRGSREEVRILDRDIRYIKQNEYALKEKDEFFFGSPLFWGLHGGGLVLLIAFLLLRAHQQKISANADLVRNRQASKISQKRLKTAHKYLKAQDKQKFYEEVLRAMWGYVSDKLGIKQADLNRDTLMENLKKRNVDESAMQSLSDVLDTCEYARYAPGTQSTGMEDLYKKAGQVIRQLENALKR